MCHFNPIYLCFERFFFAGPCPGQRSRIICEVWFNHGGVSSIQSIDTGGVAKNADPPIQGGLDDSFGEALYLNLRLTNKLWDWHISKPPSLKPLKRSKQRDQLLFHLEPEWCQKDFFPLYLRQKEAAACWRHGTQSRAVNGSLIMNWNDNCKA